MEYIKPHLDIFGMYDGSKMPIVSKLSKANTNVPIPEEQFSSRENRSSSKIKTIRQVRLKTVRQTWS